MKQILRILGLIGLILTIAPATAYFFDALDLDGVKLWMSIGMVLWFVAAPLGSRLSKAAA